MDPTVKYSIVYRCFESLLNKLERFVLIYILKKHGRWIDNYFYSLYKKCVCCNVVNFYPDKASLLCRASLLFFRYVRSSSGLARQQWYFCFTFVSFVLVTVMLIPVVGHTATGDITKDLACQLLLSYILTRPWGVGGGVFVFLCEGDSCASLLNIIKANFFLGKSPKFL